MKSSYFKHKNSTTMEKIDMMFAFILLWGIVSTTLLIHQFHKNSTLQRQLSENQREAQPKKLEVTDEPTTKSWNEESRRAKARKMEEKYNDKMKQRDEKREQRLAEQKLHEKQLQQNIPMVADQFPFTRSLETFVRSKSFYIYVVHSSSSPGDGSDATTPLEWHEVGYKDLVQNWGRNTTFDDLLDMSITLHDNNNKKQSTTEGIMKRKLILHCLPKAASTTLRRACYKNQKDDCPAIEFPRQQDPFGYRQVDDFFKAVKECTEINHFCVQGGDAGMSVINYEHGEDSEYDEREPFHFVHMVPFRKFDDWVASAIKHIYTIDGNCNRIERLLDECLGYRELYVELYSKSVLSLLTGFTFEANAKGISSQDKHHILLYNYKDVDTIVSQVSDFFGLDPLPRTDVRHKEVKGEAGTCPDVISDKFHKCHDETLIRSDAIRKLPTEIRRRVKNDRRMKSLLRELKEKETMGESEV